MERLKIETYRHGIGINVMKVSGFSEEEVKELGGMEQRELEGKVLDMLDRRNGGIGTCWKRGYGMYRMWVHSGAVFVEIGSSCD